MIFKIEDINLGVFIFPKENDLVFLRPEIGININEQKIGVYNTFQQRIGNLLSVHNNKQKILGLLLKGKPILSKVVLSNKNHKYILIDATRLDFNLRPVTPSLFANTFSLN